MCYFCAFMTVMEMLELLENLREERGHAEQSATINFGSLVMFCQI